MSYACTKEEIYELFYKIQEYNLSAPAKFFITPTEDLQRIYNGIGPDAWSSRFRKKVTELLAWFEPEALIHDWEYTYQPKTYLHFTISNIRFAVNGFYAAWKNENRSRIDILKYTRRSLLLAVICQLFGYKGYKEATKLKEV